MNGDELCAIGKCGFDLNVVDHFGHTIHHLFTGDDVRACLHKIGNRAPIAGTFNDKIADQCDRFRMIEFYPALQTAAGNHGGHGDQKLVFFLGVKFMTSFQTSYFQSGMHSAGVKSGGIAANSKCPNFGQSCLTVKQGEQWPQTFAQGVTIRRVKPHHQFGCRANLPEAGTALLSNDLPGCFQMFPGLP